MVMYKALVKLVDFAVKQVLSMLTDSFPVLSNLLLFSKAFRPLVSKL